MTALALCDDTLAAASPPSQPDPSPLTYRKCSDGASVPFSSSGAEDRSDEEEYCITSFKRERMFDILLWKYDDDPRKREDERGFESLNLEERLDDGVDEAHVSWNAAPRRKRSMSRKMRDLRAASDSFGGEGGDIVAAVEKRRDQRAMKIERGEGEEKERQEATVAVEVEVEVGNAADRKECDNNEKSRGGGEGGGGGGATMTATKNKKVGGQNRGRVCGRKGGRRRADWG